MGLFPAQDVWFLQNVQNAERLEGQFPPISVTRELGNEWAEHTAISRQNAILQFLHGKVETVSVQVRLYARDILFNHVEDDLKKLEEWKTPSPLYKNAPPVLSFWLGDGHLFVDCIIDSLSGITYGRPTGQGALRDVTLTINLKAYKKFSIEDTGDFETRYHRARERDYYELLTQREYGNALIGDVIRKRHPTQPNLQVGDVVKLPSIESLRNKRVEPKSIPLQTAYGKKDSPQRRLRLQSFEDHNQSYVSHVLKDT